MVEINVRVNEGCQAQPELLWNTEWSAAEGYGDWALAGSDEKLNVGGLAADEELETAVILCLFTDRYCPPTHPLAKYIEANDPRGWWGDGIDVRADLGEAPLGSLLWLIERSVVTDDTARWAEMLAMDALAPMIGQRSIVKAVATAYPLPAQNRMDLRIQLYGQDGATIYDRRFQNIWVQIGNQSVQ